MCADRKLRIIRNSDGIRTVKIVLGSDMYYIYVNIFVV